MDFDPYMREHLKQRDEALRLEERLRKNRKVLRGSRLAASIKRSRLLVGKARLAQ